ncbi:MAG: argininosuccinate lyase, partial [bacterium]
MGARLESAPSELLIQTAFKKELDDQAELFETMSLADLAHTLVMMDAGIVPAEAGRELLAALLKLHQRPADFQLDPSRGDLYTNREAWLSTRARGSAWLGAGRARREATTTAFLMKLRADLLSLTNIVTKT